MARHISERFWASLCCSVHTYSWVSMMRTRTDEDESWYSGVRIDPRDQPHQHNVRRRGYAFKYKGNSHITPCILMYNPWYFNILFVNNFTFKICSYSGFNQYLLLSLDLALDKFFCQKTFSKLREAFFKFQTWMQPLFFGQPLCFFTLSS